MHVSAVAHESRMMLWRAALHIMLAHLKQQICVVYQGLSHTLALSSEKLVVIVDHRYGSNLL